jgi:hypothetical protein
MKKDTTKVLGISLLLMVFFPSCTNDLNQAPNSTNAISWRRVFLQMLLHQASKISLLNYTVFCYPDNQDLQVADISELTKENQ